MSDQTEFKPNGINQLWSLSSPEASLSVTGQFPIEEIDLGSIGGTFADITSVNQAHPITQWVRGNLENITFEATLRAMDEDDEIGPAWETMQKFARRDSDLLRQPVCEFAYGSDIAMTCFVDSISNIRAGYLRPDGSLRDIKFTVTLRRYVPSVQRSTDPSEPESLSRFRYAKTGDSYESIAFDEYNQAIFGEILRRFHRYRPDLTEGDVVHVLPLNYVLKRRKIRPQASQLNTSNELTNTRLVDLFEARDDALKVIGE